MGFGKQSRHCALFYRLTAIDDAVVYIQYIHTAAERGAKKIESRL